MSLVGGYLFDSVSRISPFIMMTGLNLLLVIGALIVSAKLDRQLSKACFVRPADKPS